MELKQKIVLKHKGDSTALPVRQVHISLRWQAAVDLDLMAFYRTHDGQEGAVFSDHFPGGTLGALDTFPYIALSGDDGLSETHGEHEEGLMISRVDQFECIYICALNYTDAIRRQPSCFASYDGHVWVFIEPQAEIAIPLNATTPGTIAILASIRQEGGEYRLYNETRVVDLPAFVREIPGGRLITQ